MLKLAWRRRGRAPLVYRRRGRCCCQRGQAVERENTYGSAISYVFGLSRIVVESSQDRDQ